MQQHVVNMNAECELPGSQSFAGVHELVAATCVQHVCGRRVGRQSVVCVEGHQHMQRHVVNMYAEWELAGSRKLC